MVRLFLFVMLTRATAAGAAPPAPQVPRTLSAAHAELKTWLIPYQHGETQLEGYFAYDDAFKGKRPGVIVIHEWKGRGDYVKRRSEMLARLGYAAFAVDMYGKGVYAQTHEEAARLSGAHRSDRALMRGRALAGLNALTAQKNVDASRLAAVGYCFGGMAVLELARSGAEIKGAVSFHGGLDTPQPAGPGEIKARILALHGAEDAHTGKQAAAFQEEMRASRADWQMVYYGGAVHSFTVAEAGDDPSKGAAYNEAADRRSWQAMRDFLQEIFQ